MSADPSTKASVEQLRAILGRQQLRRDQENQLLARRMHDDLSQKATVLGLELSLLGMDVEKSSADAAAKEKIATLSALAYDLGRAIREITTQVHPKVMDEFGLIAALQSYARSLEKEQISCVVTGPESDVALPVSVANAMYHAVRDVVACVFRPVNASRLELRLEHRQDQFQLRLSGEHKDGSKQKTKEAKLDWLAIQESVLALGGGIKLKTVPGVGTSVTCSIPITPALPLSRKCVESKKIYASNPHH